jgi:hypothetical protein
MFIPDKDFFSIPDPRSNNNKKVGGEKNLLSYLFAVINFTKSKIILFLNRYRTNFFEIIDKEVKYFFTQQLLLSS